VVIRAALILAAFASACTIDTRSGAFRCDPSGTCPSGRMCSAGWCVSTGAPDANPNEPDAASCPSECSSCVAGACVIRCDTDNSCASKITCPAGMPCNVECIGTNTCNGGIDCASASACTIACSGQMSCTMGATCGAGACDVTCGGKKACLGAIDCANSCQCDVTCAGPMSCVTNTCPAPTDCTVGKQCTSTPADCHHC
jgi:hypothetical protein